MRAIVVRWVLSMVCIVSASCGSMPWEKSTREGAAAAAKSACPALGSGDGSKLALTGNAAGQVKVRAFVEAVHGLHAAADGTYDTLYSGCKAIAREAGAGKKNIKAIDDDTLGLKGDPLPRMCDLAVNALAKTDAKIVVAYAPPRCSMAVDAALECLAGCGNAVEPAQLAMSCQGGELSATCDGKCEGTCEGKAAFGCEGQCDATCSGRCDAGFKGQCGGQCEGSCDGTAMSAAGACAGVCEGKCDASASGTCSGQCRGDCSGACTADAHVQCDGTCKGACSGTMQAPTCDGEFKPPVVDATCHAMCMSAAANKLTCDKPQLTVEIAASSRKLAKALKKHVPRIVTALKLNGARAMASAKGVIDGGSALKGALGDVGGDASTCMTAGITLATSASVKLTGSFQVAGNARVLAGGSL